MRYVIIGAGAIGGALGGRLHEGGHEVVLVARGRHLSALQADGLRFSTPESTRTLRIHAVGGPEELTLHPDDVLLLTVKTQHSADLLETWAGQPVLGGGTAGDLLPLVCAQNGVESERLALRRFRRVYGMCLWMPASHLEPGHVAAPGAPLSGILTLGRYPAGADDTVRAIADDLEKSHFRAPVREDVLRWKYGKLIGNLANVIDALAGPIVDGPLMEFYRHTLAEGERVLTAAGIDYLPAAEEQVLRGDQRRDPVEGVEYDGNSSRQSVSRGAGSIETDFLNGEIVLLARLHGVPAPLNERLQHLATAFIRDGRPAGSLTPEELTAPAAL
ncbi:2-dehydropantoate 2-reductase [Kitasatospora sp. MAP12-15]|uniref:ketopantoate reductase family protein n=1 Tax=unclassified Kitasatospora TaxID=2633591 RepID=UPI002476BBB7|nr:2-dehydropantoate 2-reductase N-terminal domain-containing protein [Kitasatospora sp. MAP12-44]MDH6109498.1 2-dehydropantoate 2-reductase [Kitasatospora sp. MAP12-44]